MRRLALILTAVGGVAFAGQSCFAQSGSLFNQGGATQGGGGGGQGVGQQPDLQQGGLGGLGQGAEAAGIELSEIGAAGSQIGQNQFVGQGADGFTGNRQVGQQQQQGANARFTQADGGRGFQQPEQPSLQSQRRIRPRYRVAFEYQSLTSAGVAERSQRQVQTFRTAFNLPDSMSVELDEEGTAILRGQAVSLEMSRLIAQVVRMEPGVRDVKNELVVPEAPAP